MGEPQPGIEGNRPADFHYQPTAAEIVAPTEKIPDRNFILFEADRKLNFAKSLLDQYAVDKAELMANLNAMEDTSPDKPGTEETIRLMEEQTARIQKLIELGNQLDQSADTNETLKVATEIADTVFPYETNHYSDDALSAKLETMQHRLNYLTQTDKIQIPKLLNEFESDTDEIYAWKSEIRDLKNYIPQIQAEIARRKLSPLGRPILRVLEKPLYDDSSHEDVQTMDSGDYQLIDDDESPAAKLHPPLPPTIDLKRNNDVTIEERDYLGTADTESNIPTTKMPPQD